MQLSAQPLLQAVRMKEMSTHSLDHRCSNSEAVWTSLRETYHTGTHPELNHFRHEVTRPELTDDVVWRRVVGRNDGL